MKRLLVVGGHSGDEAVMAGGVAAKVIREGGECLFVSVTNGDGGHPVLGRAEYTLQKNAEAEKSAAVLGASCILWPVSSGSIEISPAREAELASIIRDFRPDTVITHWKSSMHRDHVASYHLTVKAIELAKKESFSDGKEPFAVTDLFFGDNWEDADEWKPTRYVPLTEADEAKWLAACRCYQFFRDGFYDFDYETYYTSLHKMRGTVGLREAGLPGPKLATALMVPPVTAYDLCVL